ncbi:type II CRISPR RNA-guided endonuclease Cas9 [Haloferula sp. A504]|uniref:type II CRISPR RNA-guided endonuclease Cas9 n=1 Tax=Haloferula sp. A504 TaxID=3373601 RepID=UPI0031CAA24D|nr:hypothetical protein [Verrucomicrobiaceae bacterium E54]
MDLTLSFDIGYASIGWCVLSSSNQQDPEFLGTGVVTFPTDDCLASTRRDLRRTRRHIRSTRLRIERLKQWLIHRRILTRAELDAPGHPAPFLLAAAALNDHRTLNPAELWTVLRWYAHNRGYDGNSRWARDEKNEEDTEKESNARQLMAKHGTTTMAETVCACLGLKPAEHDQRISSDLPYKTLNAAYPRSVVTKEVADLIRKTPGLDPATARLVLKDSPLTRDDRNLLTAAGIKLPRRYQGGLLFGQLVPRFDNRIIARCPITWARQYDDAIESGEPEGVARKLADKFSKVPTAKSPEFLRYRFAMLLANLKVDDGQPLPATLRRQLWNLAERQGRLTHKDLAREIKDAGHSPYNLDATFKIHPDSEDALLLDPARAYAAQNQTIKAIWPHLDEDARQKALTRWTRGKSITLAELHQLSGMAVPVMEAIEAAHTASQKRTRKASSKMSLDEFLLQPLAPRKISGRAPYARPVLEQVVTEVLAGHHPRKASRSTDPENGEDKPADGVLYDLGIPTSRVRLLQAERPIDQLTNNHLVRHRMLILDRLVDDILAEFGTGGNEFSQVVVEVARELKEFSGKTAKEIASELKSRLKDFKAAVDYLAKHAPDLPVSGGIIRKARIAMDMNWHCPFTGESFDAYDLPNLEREHIIPYSTRSTSALHSLVLTWPEVNRMKGKRTARQFIAEFEGQPVQGKSNLSLFTLKNYDSFVDKLDTKGHDDDRRRKKARKALLATTDFEDKELGFTDGALTQSSQLMKLAMGALRKKLPNARIDPIPGPVNAEIRKSWDLIGTLSLACPEILDENGDVRTKNEIRGLTHLHHALDAATLALAAHFFPLRQHGQNQAGKIWQSLMKRRRTDEEKDFLFKLGIFDRYQRERLDRDGNEYHETDVRLRDLPAEIKNALARSLAESRVMQHVPSDQSGTKAERTTWKIVTFDGPYTILLQRPNRSTFTQAPNSVKPRWENQKPSKEALKLLDMHGLRLSQRERNLVQRGLLKLTKERTTALLGPNPTTEKSKLQPHGKGRGAIVVSENYGIALLTDPRLIPHSKINETLRSITESQGGVKPKIIRKGDLIKVAGGTWKGTWRVTSVKNSEAYGVSVDLASPAEIGLKKGNARIPQMMAAGLEILPRRYTGYPITGQ